MNKFFLLLVCVALSMLMPAAFAAPPPTINYQGFLTSATGTPASGPVVMTFKLYSAATGGAALYTELQPSVNVSNGNFNAVIGALSPIPLPFDQPYWLAVTINADAEMIPRQPLASSPYAFRASSLDSTATIAGSQITGSITTATIPVANIIGAVAGPPGPQGIQGLTGVTGATGSIGPIGVTGAIGPAGPNDITGNLTMVNSTATTGSILKGANRFIHNFGSLNTFIGQGAGNFTMTGTANTVSGAGALAANTTGNFNTASGWNALAANSSGSQNTATGINTLAANTTGINNTGHGANALSANVTGTNNTASGRSALASNTFGEENTASGSAALQFNTTGFNNTASGSGALNFNTTGFGNTANGKSALANNTTGFSNIATGAYALNFNTIGNDNTAIGFAAMQGNFLGTNAGLSNTAIGSAALSRNSGNFNTATGRRALELNTTGTYNTAIGLAALASNTTGTQNIAVGAGAGFYTTGNNNIDIGSDGAAGGSGFIRIGQVGLHFLTYIAGIYNAPALVNGTFVYVQPDGRLGTNPSSRRFKDDITDMNAASSALMNLRPVTFHYKTDQNPSGRTLQYGLIAEEVAEVYPGLVIHSADGEIDAVAYQHLPPMLLNEFQKQQRTIQAQAADIQKQAIELAEQRAKTETLERKLQNIEALLGGR